MKLRMEPGSIKIRMSTGEISKLFKDNYIEENIRFSSDTIFKIAIVIQQDIHKLLLLLEDLTLRIMIPGVNANIWKNSRQIGVRSIFTNDVGDEIEVVVEKDLPKRNKAKS